MDIDALKAEIDADPAGLGYGGKTDEEIAALLNSDTTGRTMSRSVVPTHEVLDQIDPGEYSGILNSDSKRSALAHLLGLGTVDPGSSMAAQIILDVFGAGSTTVQNLQAFRNRTVSRAQELGLGAVRTGHVAEAGRL